VFLDVDGTLLHLAPTPDAVTVSGRTIALLKTLYAATGGALALISGRPLQDLDQLFSPLTLPAAGLHGLERRDAAGVVHRHEPGGGGLQREMHLLREFASLHPGIVIEDKKMSIAIHYRAAPDQESAVTSLARRCVEQLGPAYCLQLGKMVAEIRPSGRDKGTALREFLQEQPFAGRTPVFVGDDVTDEDAFGFVNELGGNSVKVGDGETRARWRLDGPDAVLNWLGS
jgi:trehalose 6-phosphate phosphatase